MGDRKPRMFTSRGSMEGGVHDIADRVNGVGVLIVDEC